jgi:hypothetical protein
MSAINYMLVLQAKEDMGDLEEVSVLGESGLGRGRSGGGLREQFSGMRLRSSYFRRVDVEEEAWATTMEEIAEKEMALVRYRPVLILIYKTQIKSLNIIIFILNRLISLTHSLLELAYFGAEKQRNLKVFENYIITHL